ncbi:uroporphyrinogen decarboxylase family protein [Bengtsoniella intestinalis]|uniref:uroporphyrinogen decarboxylase family protein n=1 Tax=Bengtsoniella intestinalis TaxID=3073143 RepID=UPI00391F0F49
MLPRERVWTTLNHQEPDRIPVDFASTHITGMHQEAYKSIALPMGLPVGKMNFQRSGTAEIAEEVLQKIGSDVRGVWPNKLGEGHWAVKQWHQDNAHYILDEWGATWKKGLDGELYYSVVECPLPQEELEWEELKAYPYPTLDNDAKFVGMKEKAKAYHDAGYALFIENPMVEIFHSQTRVRGYENFFTDLLIEPEMATYMMAQTEEQMEAYYKRVLTELSDYPLIVRLSDDLGSQSSLLIGADCYRELVKPFHKKLIDFIKSNAKNDVKIFFHSDGAIDPVLPDLVDIGIDILNPIQYTCQGMDTATVKRKYGDKISFWGGGIDTQSVFKEATVQGVRDEVRRQMDILAPGGGFVFSQVHNFQKGMDVEKFWAIWETVEKYGAY